MPIQFAAKKHGWRQTDKGYVLTLLIDPTDQWQEAALAPLGSPFGVAMVPINPETGEPAQPHKTRRGWDEMSRVQRAGILASDRRFQKWSASCVEEENETDAAEYIRRRCAVASRRDIDDSEPASGLFDQMVIEYRRDTGQMAEVRF